MYTSVTVEHILDRKGYGFFSVDADATIIEALHLMAEKDVGALIVLEDSKPVGIFSERDYARRLVLKGKNEHDTLVKEVMTNRVIAITLNHKIIESLALMTGKHIRHLPVIDDERNLIGVISISDVVEELTAEQTFIIDQLVQYIGGEDRIPPVPEKSEIELPSL